MAPVKRIVKRVALTLGILAFWWYALGYVGIRWGFTPIPKPPPRVRLQPLSPPIAKGDLKPDNGAYQYMNAVAILKSYHWSKEAREQVKSVAVGITSGDTNDIEQTLREVQPALELVRNASRASSCQMPQINPTTDDTLGSLRELARLLIADGKWAERKGDFARASEDYIATVKFGADCTTGGPILHALVGDSIVSMGTQALRAWVLQNARSTNELRIIRDKVDDIRTQATAFAETLRYELIDERKQLHGTAFAHAKWWWGPSESVTFRCFDAAYGDLIQNAERPFWESKSEALEKKWTTGREHVGLWAFNRPIAQILIAMMLPALEQTRTKFIRADIELQATGTICALKEYEIARGSPPENLSELVPDVLPAVPIDPCDGKPMRYRREGREWVLWSVGSDMKNDNAAWHEYKYRTANDERRGGDIYFKSTEPQDDLTDYLSKNKSKQSS